MSVPEFSLAGKRAVVIAGTRGVGLGITLALAEAGADVAVAGLTQANADKAAGRVRALGRQAWSYAVDATKDSQMRTFAEAAIAEFGPFDVVVNCLGEHYPAVVAKRPGREEAVATEDLWREIIDVNLTEAFLGCHYFGPHLLERGKGTVINISAMHAERTRPKFAMYAAAKSALNHLTRGVALEWAPFGVTCNGIAPGLFPDTEQMTLEAIETREKQAAGRVPLKRTGTLREVGLLAVFLASDAATYITGQTVVTDGGLSLAPQEPDI